MYYPSLEAALNHVRLLHEEPQTEEGVAWLIEPDGQIAGCFTVPFCRDWVTDNPEWRFERVGTRVY